MIKITLSPEQSEYSAENAVEVVRIEVQGGPSVLYSDSIGAGALVNVSWVCTAAEYESLVETVNIDLNRGSDKFLIDLILEGPYPVEYEAQFVPYTFMLAKQEGQTYFVVAQLEVSPNEHDPDYDEIVVDIYPDNPSNLFNLLERLVNVLMPDALT